MPLHIHCNNEEMRLAFWLISEPESFFLERTGFVDPENLKLYKHPQVRLQWLASRLLLFQLLGEDLYKTLKKDDKGKPFSVGNSIEISISHSGNLVAVAVSLKNIGIDIQEFTPKLVKIAAKFVKAPLLSLIEKNEFFSEAVHVHWGVKEALFKAYGSGNLDYKENLFLEWNSHYNIEGEAFIAYVNKSVAETYAYRATYEKVFENFLLCTVTKTSV